MPGVSWLLNMKIIIILTLLLAYPLMICGQSQIFPFREGYAFASGSNEGKVELHLKDTVLQRGKPYSPKYTFYVTNGSYPVYNWQFNNLITLPGQLAIYNQKKEYVGDLLARETISRRGVGNDDWTFLYGGSHVGSTLGFQIGRSHNSLRAGVYHIQLILYKAFVSPNPFRAEGERIDFYQTFDAGELCRSNIVKVEVIDP